jgi:hypothetical protein
VVTIDDIKIADLGYYINLDKRTDRNEKLLKGLKEYNIRGIERQSARCETDTPQLNLINTTFDIYNKFLETNAQTLLILEDDCLFLPSIKENTDEIFNNIYSVDWDLFWLGGINRKPPIFYKNNCYVVSSPSYAQSYIIKRKMAQDVLTHFNPNWNNLNPDELLCLFAYGYDMAKDPNRFEFYQKEQPLDHFKTEYKCLCYEQSFTTQYNSYSDLWCFVTNLEEWIPNHHPKSKTW